MTMYSVNPVRQGLNECWAATTALVLGLAGRAGIDEVKRRASAAHIALNTNGTIPSSSVHSLANALNLNYKNMASPPLMLSAQTLNQVLARSPAAAFGNYNYPGVPTSTMHVLLFYGTTINPPGSTTNPMVHFVDSFTARRFNYLMEEFNENLGSVDYFIYR